MPHAPSAMFSGVTGEQGTMKGRGHGW